MKVLPLPSALLLALLYLAAPARATLYEVGPGKTLAEVGDVPWESLAAGDTVQIHGRPEPYKAKWVICRKGTERAWITVRGIAGTDGRQPVIDGENALTRHKLNSWSEARAVIKVGGANTPADTMPAYILIEGLDIRGARPPFRFSGRGGVTPYAKNASAVFVEKGAHVTVRNCALHDCGNGFFASSQSSDVIVEGCQIYDNGIEGSIYEHNNYTEARGIIFQFNHFGPLRTGCPGNNLKDRSAGLVVRYNWIEGGNRQLDLVDSNNPALLALPTYHATFVYGNILVEPDGAGNRQVCHYGGDSGKTEDYRKGTLFFCNNTVVSTRRDRTTLFRLSTADEHCQADNNIFFVRGPGRSLALLEESGTIEFSHNWLKPGYLASFSGGAGVKVNDRGGNMTGNDPGFVGFAKQDFHLSGKSPCRDQGTRTVVAPERQYVKHQRSEPRPAAGVLDLGALAKVASE